MLNFREDQKKTVETFVEALKGVMTSTKEAEMKQEMVTETPETSGPVTLVKVRRIIARQNCERVRNAV